MPELLLALNQTLGVFILSVLVLIGAIGLTAVAIGKTEGDQKFLAGIIGLLLGLFGGGGIGTLSADRAADNAADQVKDQVEQQVQEAQDQAPGGAP
jgi:apolipoprotein N-acyltransferase